MWDFESSVFVVVCLPKRDGVGTGTSFYGDILVGLELDGLNGEPVYEGS